MKLSSPPTRWALTSVVAAAMKHGPTRVSRIACDLDMPVETCRYYLKRFYKAGFRFLPVVDYRALGLSPHVAFIRFSKQVDGQKRENFLRWLDSVYVVYRAALSQEREYLLEIVPPEGDGKTYAEMLALIQESNVFEDYVLDKVIGGYYQPEWVKAFDFTIENWAQELEVEIPKIPLNVSTGQTKFDRIDLILLEELEMEPTIKMNTVAQKYNISPQLVSYHREKHVEGSKLITGFVPVRRTKHKDVQYVLSNLPRTYNSQVAKTYMHGFWMTNHRNVVRFHTPIWETFTQEHPVYIINPYDVKAYTIPSERYTDTGWMRMRDLLQQLEKLLKAIEK